MRRNGVYPRRLGVLVMLVLAVAAPGRLPGQERGRGGDMRGEDSLALAALAARLAEDSLAARARLKAAAESLIFAPVAFRRGGSSISPAAGHLLERKAWYLVRNPLMQLRVAGFPDRALRGEEGSGLARRRALSVRAALVALGVESRRVDIVPAVESPRGLGGRVEFQPVGELTEVDIPPPGVRPPPLVVDQRLGGQTRRAAPWATVRVYYATDRRPTGDPAPERFFGAERSAGGALAFGTLDVTIPRAHRVGVVEQPSWFRLELTADPKTHMTVRRVQPATEGRFLDDLRTTVAKSEGREAFVFIHGYNVTFAAAALRTAQLAYDLGFPGAPILYSWPSKGTLVGYAADAEEAAWTAGHLRAFLDSVVRAAGARRVHLIAHSMGNRALAVALQGMPRSPNDTVFNQVVLTAPDIDADLFTQQIAPAIRGVGRRITMYASSRDKALLAARVVSTHRRLGYSHGGIVTATGMDAVDASTVDTDLLGHGYFASNRAVIDDLFALIRNDLPPQRRNLRRVGRAPGEHWRIP